MPLAGEQLTYGWALALCYHVGWRGKALREAVALMCAESARYTEAYHENLDEDGEVDSTDWGLFQINDKWHPDFEMPAGFNAIYNAEYAHQMWKDHGKSFKAWAAYNSGAYKQFSRIVLEHWLLERWRKKIANVEKRFA